MMSNNKSRKRYKILYKSIIIDEETGHKEILYLAERSKIGMTLKEILQPEIKREDALIKMMNMKPFDKKNII